jgi:hypothetical protein
MKNAEKQAKKAQILICHIYAPYMFHKENDKNNVL